MKELSNTMVNQGTNASLVIVEQKVGEFADEMLS